MIRKKKATSRRDISTPLSREKGSKRRPLCCITVLLIAFLAGGTLLKSLSTTDAASLLTSYASNVERPSHLILTTPYGTIRIKLLPDLSPESVAHIAQVVKKGCKDCNFYRSESALLLQGIIRPKSAKLNNERPPKGPCPAEFASVQQKCLDYDPNCACHGPTMTRGMVGWAGGKTGPDFFINVFDKPVDWWGQTHTVWGMVETTDLSVILDDIMALPVNKKGELHYLKKNIPFQMEFGKA